MKILIMGGAGFVGANLAIYLSQQGHLITVMDNLVRRGSEINLGRFKNHSICFKHGDIRCLEDWMGLKADWIINCAAQASAIDGYANPTFDFANNTLGTLRALEFCKAQNAGIIFFSSNKVYPVHAINHRIINEKENSYACSYPIPESTPLDGGDRSLYGCSKIMSDLMIQEWAESFQFTAIINRCSCLSGPWQWARSEQGWIAWWIIAHQLGLPLRYIGFNGKQVRDVLFIDDLCRLIELELTSVAGTHVFNVGGGPDNAISLRECTALTQKITGKTVNIDTETIPRRADFKWYVSDISRVCQHYEWKIQIGLEEGFTQINKWVVDNLKLLESMYGK